MTVKDFYDLTGGGYDVMISKFKSDATITSFLKIFKRDKSYAELTEKLEADDMRGAFAAAHTLKGVTLNLNLEGMINPVVAVVEALRAGNLSGAKGKFPALKAAYEKVNVTLSELLPQ